jgi:hypothetical protein
LKRETLWFGSRRGREAGVLVVLHNDIGDSWVARGIEEFKGGEWIGELGQMHSLLAAWKTEQKTKDEVSQEDQLKTINELKEKLSKLPRVGNKAKSWFRQLFRRWRT